MIKPFFSPPPASAPEGALTATDSSVDQVLHAWREQLLILVLRASVGVGLLTIGSVASLSISRGLIFLAAIYAAVYAVLLVATFVPLPYWARSGLFLLVLYIFAALSLYQAGLRSDSRLFLLAFVVMSAALYGRRLGWAAFSLMAATLVVAGILSQSGVLVPLTANMNVTTSNFVALSLVALSLTLLLMTSMLLLQQYVVTALQREITARQMLEQAQTSLEQRVIERTRALEASFQVSQRLASIVDPDELISSVVDEIQQAFGYYYAQTYLFDETRQWLVMTGGTGQAGRTLLSEHFRIARGKGLVGKAAESGQRVLVRDTLVTPEWLPNIHLPDTRCEIAVPIAIGEQVIGVLDVQQNQVNAFSEEDAEIIQSIANQLAVAVQNARLYTLAQRQAEREGTVNRISQHIQTATTVEDVMQVTLRELGAALGADRGRIQLQVKDN